MEVFARVAELGSFTRAAERMNLAPASVSATVQNLEAVLGVRLLTRTTRKVSLTDDGRAYFERTQHLLAEIEELEAALTQTRTRPQGKLRVEIPTGLGHLYVVPALPAFSEKYPDVQVIMTLNDRFVDFSEEEVDVILRVGKLADSGMVAKQIYQAKFVVCASPAYLRQKGAPKQPSDLVHHNCLGYFSASLGRSARWTFNRDGEIYTHAPAGTLHVNNGEAVADFAIAGAGIVCMLETSLVHAIRDGKLVQVLPEWETQSTPVSVLYWPSRHLSAKVRVFVDFVTELFAQKVPHVPFAKAVVANRGRTG
jgi:LysR family transcriptional regulator for bpeEF and oprC